MQEDLLLVQAQHLSGFVLPLGNGFDAAPVDLGEIAGIVDGEGQDGGSKPGHGGKPEHEAGAVEDNDQLQHQRGAPDDPHESSGQPPQGGEAAHGAEADHQAQGDGKNQGHGEDLQGLPEAAQQL